MLAPAVGIEKYRRGHRHDKLEFRRKARWRIWSRSPGKPVEYLTRATQRYGCGKTPMQIINDILHHFAKIAG